MDAKGDIRSGVTAARGRVGRGLFAAVLVLGVMAAPSVAGEPPAGSRWSDAYLRSGDGTLLHADVFRPSAPEAARTPVVLVVSPYLGVPTARQDPTPPRVLPWYRRLYDAAIARGFAIVQVSFRGTGASQGCQDFGGPGERGDVQAAVQWAASRPWSSGRVGMLGHSYDGFAAVMALAEQPAALRAAVVTAPAIDLYRGIYMNGVAYLQGRGVTPYYQSFQLMPPLAPGQALSAYGGRFTNPSCSADVLGNSQDGNPAAPFWRKRNLIAKAARDDVPILWTHGFLDGRDDFSSTRPDNFLDLWKQLRAPHRAWFGQFPHLVPGEPDTWGEPHPVGRGGFVTEALDWLDAYVGRDSSSLAKVRRQPIAVQEGRRGGWRSEARWPPADARAYRMPLLPGSYSDSAGNKAEQGDDSGGSCQAVRARCNPLSRTGQGTWTFSQPLPASVHLAGVPRLEAEVGPGATPVQVIAFVYDIDTSLRATLVARGAYLIRRRGAISFDLYPQDWRLAPGHRVGVLLSGSDDFYFTPGTSGARVRVTRGSIALPLLDRARIDDLPGRPSRAVLDRTSFPVDPGTVAARSSTLALPPKSRPRLRMRVRPRRLRAGRRVVLRVKVTARIGGTNRSVKGARVRLGRRAARTNRRGHARLVLRARHGGRRVLKASKPNYKSGRGRVRVLPAAQRGAGSVRFTG